MLHVTISYSRVGSQEPLIALLQHILRYHIIYFASTVLRKSIKSELRRISLIVLANFRRNIGDISWELSHRSRDNSTKVRRNCAGSLKNSQSETKYRRSEFSNPRKYGDFAETKRNIGELSCRKSKITWLQIFASEISSIIIIQKRLFTNRKHGKPLAR